MPRLITEPNLDQYDPEQPAYGWQAPPPWWADLDQQILNLITTEWTRFRTTLAGDWRLLRIAWCALRTLFS